MKLFYVIIWGFFFYIIFRLIRTLFRVFSSPKENSNRKSNVNEPKNKKSKIDKKDIIEAEFEEIKDKEKEDVKN